MGPGGGAGSGSQRGPVSSAGWGRATTLTELGAARFVMAVDKLLAVYTAAMNPAPSQLAGRRSIMARHATNPGFRALAVLDGDGEPVAFSYGFHGEAGQWWHDMVNYALSASAGAARGRALADRLVRGGGAAREPRLPAPAAWAAACCSG